MNYKNVPEANLNAFQVLFLIETALRELIISSLSSNFKESWFRQRIPEDIKRNCLGRYNAEKGLAWTQFTNYHLLYYSDFADLQKIILQKDNWKEVFRSIFRNQQIIQGTLTELESIRNKIAHNRRITDTDFEILKGSYTKLRNAIGVDDFDAFCEVMTTAPDIRSTLETLRRELDETRTSCSACAVLENLDTITTIVNCWWFDEAYLESEITSVMALRELLIDYNELPRTRGDGYKVERWLQQHNVLNLFGNADLELQTLLRTRR